MGEGFHVLGAFDEAVSLTDSGWFDNDISKVFEVANGFDDFFFGFLDLFGAVFGVDFSPFVSRFTGAEEFTEEGLAGGVESVEEVFEVS